MQSVSVSSYYFEFDVSRDCIGKKRRASRGKKYKRAAIGTNEPAGCNETEESESTAMKRSRPIGLPAHPVFSREGHLERAIRTIHESAPFPETKIASATSLCGCPHHLS